MKRFCCPSCGDATDTLVERCSKCVDHHRATERARIAAKRENAEYLEAERERNKLRMRRRRAAEREARA